jgi:transcriptional regulator with XRE-family HTH domain
MSVEAVGIYLDRLAMLRGLKVKAVATQAGVKPGYISRLISRDIKEPSASVLRALTEAVGGNWADVGALLDSRAGRTQAEALADVWYAQIMRTTSDRDALRRRLVEAIDGLLDHPEDLDRALDRP